MATVLGITQLRIDNVFIQAGQLIDVLMPDGELLRGSMEESAYLQGDELDLIRDDLPESLKQTDSVFDLRVGTGKEERSVYFTEAHPPRVWTVPRSLIDWPNMNLGDVDITYGDTVNVTQDDVTHTLILRQMSILQEPQHLALAPEHLRNESVVIRLLGTNGETVWLHGREEPTVRHVQPNIQMPAFHASL